MIVVGSEILRRLKTGQIQIGSFHADQLQKATYQARLDSRLHEVTSQNGRTRGRSFSLTRGAILSPDKRYLGQTVESVSSLGSIVSMSPETSLCQLGLFVHNVTNWGWHKTPQHLLFELTTAHPIRLFAFTPIVHISFWDRSPRNSVASGVLPDTAPCIKFEDEEISWRKAS